MLVKAHEDSRRIQQDYVFLKNQLSGLESVKNQEI